MSGISSIAAGGLENNKKYNGIEFENDFDLNTYDAFFRELDPQTGRWWQIDPEIESMDMWSPYASNYDNPITYSDLMGDEPDDGDGGGDDPPKKGFWAKAGDFVSGVGSGVASGAKGLYDFATEDAWKGETWGNMAKAVTVLAVNANSGGNDNTVNQMLSATDNLLGTNLAETNGAIGDATTKFVKNVPNMSANDWGKATGEVLFAVAGTKGAGALKNLATGSKVAEVTNAASKVNKVENAVTKLSKVQKSTTVEKIGNKFTKTTEVRPGRGPGQSRAEYIRYKNTSGSTIKSVKDTYDRANKFQHRKVKELPKSN